MKYKRVLLKLSGEVLKGNENSGLCPNYLKNFASEIEQVKNEGVELAIVVGGGNIFRGKESKELGIEKVQADYMGMLATVMNGLALQSALENCQIDTRLMSSIPMDVICEPYIRRRAIRHLEKKRIVILAAGLGNPCVTTDSAASWKAIELKADVLLKGTSVNGVYSSDPKEDKLAFKFNKISFQEVLKRNLNVMDLTAFTFSQEQNISIIVFDINIKNNLLSVIRGDKVGTIVSNNKTIEPINNLLE